MKDLSVEHKAAILLGMKAGDEAVDKCLVSGATVINGWTVGSLFGDLLSAPGKLVLFA